MVEIVTWLRDSYGITFQRQETLFASDSEKEIKSPVYFPLLILIPVIYIYIYIYKLQKLICRYIMYFVVFLII